MKLFAVGADASASEKERKAQPHILFSHFTVKQNVGNLSFLHFPGLLINEPCSLTSDGNWLINRQAGGASTPARWQCLAFQTPEYQRWKK